MAGSTRRPNRIADFPKQKFFPGDIIVVPELERAATNNVQLLRRGLTEDLDALVVCCVLGSHLCSLGCESPHEEVRLFIKYCVSEPITWSGDSSSFRSFYQDTPGIKLFSELTAQELLQHNIVVRDDWMRIALAERRR